MRQAFLLFFLFIFAPNLCRSQNSTQEILKELDQTIRNKAKYHAEKRQSIDSLQNMKQVVCGKALMNVYLELYRSYAHFQSDSALLYTKLLYAQAVKCEDQKMQEVALIKQSLTMGIMGTYHLSNAQLDSLKKMIVTPEGQLQYMHVRRTIYGWLAEYTKALSDVQESYTTLTELYRDSILTLETDPISHAVCMADKEISQGNIRAAESLLTVIKEQAKGEQLAYTLYNMATVKKHLGQTDSLVHYLARTAIHDIRRGVTEYIALQELAVALYERGEIERAYNYMVCAMEDATFCNARLRSIAIAEIYPIIDHAHQEVQNSESRARHMAVIAFALLTLLIIGFAVYFYFESKRLRYARSQLYVSNSRLENANRLLGEANADLKKQDSTKEKYITFYLNRCRSYIENMDEYRKNLLRLAKAGKQNDVIKQLKSGQYFDEEKQHFFNDFDTAFLDTHPNFVQRFNELLQPEHRIIPPDGGHLTPELRIFALIRLGVKDIGQIAHFLNYSLPTIYNYRSRIHAIALYPKKEFEQRLMEI